MLGFEAEIFMFRVFPQIPLYNLLTHADGTQFQHPDSQTSLCLPVRENPQWVLITKLSFFCNYPQPGRLPLFPYHLGWHRLDITLVCVLHTVLHKLCSLPSLICISKEAEAWQRFFWAIMKHLLVEIEPIHPPHRFLPHNHYFYKFSAPSKNSRACCRKRSGLQKALFIGLI